MLNFLCESYWKSTTTSNVSSSTSSDQECRTKAITLRSIHDYHFISVLGKEENSTFKLAALNNGTLLLYYENRFYVYIRYNILYKTE